MIHAFVSSRIDSCNALLFGIPEKNISKLQIVQTSAARIIERAKGRDPITPMLTRLHWLPVDKRIVYKKFLLCHKVINHQPPTYLTNIITLYIPQRNLRSSNKHLLVVPSSSTCTYGDRAFASADTGSFMKSLKLIFLHCRCKKVLVKCIENLLHYYALYISILLLLLLLLLLLSKL